MPVVLGYVDVVCTALGGGLYDPAGDVGCTIIGSTGMHMRLATSADEVVLNAERQRLHHAVPGAGHLAQMQSNMAATLNIDWLLDLAARSSPAEGVDAQRAPTCSRRSTTDVLDGQPGRVALPPLHLARPASAGRSSTLRRGAQFIGLRSRHRLLPT